MTNEETNSRKEKKDKYRKIFIYNNRGSFSMEDPKVTEPEIILDTGDSSFPEEHKKTLIERLKLLEGNLHIEGDAERLYVEGTLSDHDLKTLSIYPYSEESIIRSISLRNIEVTHVFCDESELRFLINPNKGEGIHYTIYKQPFNQNHHLHQPDLKNPYQKMKILSLGFREHK